MSRLKKCFEDRKAFVGYVTAGDGGLDHSLQSILALIKGGVDVLEVGVPFSDPVADGPVIQAAAARALEHHITLEDVLDLVRQVRERSEVPIILFTYYNPILVANQNGDFFQRAKKAGVDAILVVDMSLEEMDEYYDTVIAADIDPILLISPSTPVERIKLMGKKGRGMLYYVCRKGTTGVKNSLPEDLTTRLQDIKSCCNLPTVAGFGISNSDMAAAVLQHADGFVVGSLFVQAIADNKTPEELTELARSIDPRSTN